MGDPKHLPEFALSELASLVAGGRYRRWTDPSDVPDPLRDWSGYPGRGDFRGVALAVSSTSQRPPTLGGLTVPPGRPVYLVRTVRRDASSTGQHMNADDRLLFEDSEGRVIRVVRRRHPQHFERLSRDAGLTAAVESGQLPPRDEGPLSDFGRGVSFST